MPIPGFSQRWKDFPDYIIGITKEIWEDRGIATLHQYYAPTSSCARRPPSCVAIRTSLVRPWRRWRSFRTGNCWPRT